jgi:hypothetical protein
MKRHSTRALRLLVRFKRQPFLNPKRVIVLFLTGCALGLLMIRLGWAEETSHTAKKHHPKHKTHSHQTHHSHHTQHAHKLHHAKQTHLAHHKKAHHTQVASRRAVRHAPAVPVKEYSHPDGMYALHYPADWRVNANDSALLVHSRGENLNRGVFGIVRRPDDQPNEDAVAREFHAADRPTDLTLEQAQVAGLPATKLIGSNREDPNNQMVEYYVQGTGGHQYYILLMAPRDEWKRYSVSFDGMLRSLSLN